MCGIYITNHNFNKGCLKKLNTIKFRGPDNTGYSKIDNVSIGHLRLSIIDLDKRSNQLLHYKVFILHTGEV